MIENAQRVERQLRDAITGAPNVAIVKGRGCLIGVEFKEECHRIHAHLLEERIITGTSSDPKVLRLLPPLCTLPEQVELFAEGINAIGVPSTE